jgi:hypothetical protein
MRVFRFIFIMLVFLGCVSNPGGVYQEYFQANQSNEFDFSDTASYTYNASFAALSSSGATLNPQFIDIDDFSDNTNSDWVTWVNGVAGIIVDESSSRLNFSCTGSNWAGVYYNPLPAIGDHMVYAEVTNTTFNSGGVIGFPGRYFDADNMYMGQTFSNTYYIFKREAGVWGQLTTTGGFTPSAGTTYAMKMRVTGTTTTTIQYKIWDILGAEPVGFSITTSELEPPSTTIKTGALALTCFNAEGYWDNIRYYPGTNTTNYTTSATSVVFPKVLAPETVASWDSFVVSESISGSDEIRYDASADNGVTYLYYNGAAWVASSGSADATKSTTFNANLSTFPTTSDSINIRAFLISNDGSTSPTINSATLNYTLSK